MTAIESIIREEFAKLKLNPDLGVAIGRHESGLNPNAVNLTGGDLIRGGSYGALQMSLKTARDTGFKGSPAELMDPRTNAAVAAKHIKELTERYSDVQDVISAYNSGKPLDAAPTSTREKYVPGVLSFLTDSPDDFSMTFAPSAAPDPALEVPLPIASLGADGDPSAAREALALSQRTGRGPDAVADDPAEASFATRRDDLQALLDLSPTVKEYAGQSTTNAQAVADDMGNLSASERFSAALMGDPRATKGYDAPPQLDVFTYFLRRGILGVSASIKAFTALMAQRIVDDPQKFGSLRGFPMTEQEIKDTEVSRAKLEQSIQETEQQIAQPPPPGVDPTSYMGRVIEAVPGLGVLAASSLAGPEAVLATLYAQSAGDLYKTVRNDPRLTPDEKALVSAGGGFAAAMVGGATGQRLINALIPRALFSQATQAVPHILIDELATSKVWPEILKAGGRNMISGMLMSTGMDLSETLAVELALAHKEGRPVNTSTIVNSIRRGLEGGAVLAPFGAVGALAEHTEALGRWANSVSDSVRLRGNVEAQKASKLAKDLPDQAALLIRQMPGEGTIYLTPDAAEKLGLGPPPGSRATGSFVPVAREGFLLHPDAESVLKDAKLDPDNLTPREFDKEGERLAAERTVLRESLSKLMAERDFITANEEDTPARREKLNQINEQMRHEAVTAPLPESGGPGMGAPTEGAPAEGQPTEVGPPPPPSLDVDPREFARQDVAERTIGEYAGLHNAYANAERSANAAVVRLQEKALKASERSIGTAQAGIEAGIASGEQGRGSATMNMQFARTARFREWLKGLNTADRKPESIPEPTNAETGLYNIPGVNVEVPKSEAEKWYALGEAQRKEAIVRFKASEKSQETAESKYVKSTVQESQAGDAAAEAQAHRRARDVAGAMRSEIRANIQRAKKVIDYVGRQDSASIREKMYAAGDKYGGLYDGILNSLGIGRKRTGGPPPDVDRIILEGDSLPHPEFLKELLQNPRELKDMTISEAQALRDSLRALRRNAAKSLTTTVEGRDASRVQWIADIQQELIKTGHEAGQFVYGEEGTGAQRRYAANANPEVLLGTLGKWGKDRLTQLYKALKYESDLQGRFMKELEVPDELKDLAKKEVPYDFFPRTKRMRFLPKTISMRDVWRMAAMVGNESGMKKMAVGHGVTPVEIENFLQKHMQAKAEWDYVQRRWAANEDLYKLEMEVNAKRGDVPPKKLENRQITVNVEVGAHGASLKRPITLEGGYDPFRWYDGVDGAPQPVSARDPYRGLRGALDTPHRFMEDRVENFASVADVSADRLKAHYLALIHDIAFSDYTRDTHRMFNDPLFKDVVRDHLGSEWYKALLEWKNVTALGRTLDLSTGSTWYSNIYRSARSLVGQAVFSLNLPVLLGQEGHVPLVKFALDIGSEHMAIGWVKSFTPEGRAEAYRDSNVVPFRADRYREKLNTVLAEQTRGNRLPHIEALNAASHEAYHAMDSHLSQTIWHAKMSEQLSKGVDRATAIEAADRAVAQAMPPLSVTQQSMVVRDPLWGMLMLVRNFPNTVWNMKALMRLEARSRIAAGENPTWVEAGRYGRYLGMTAGIAIGAYLMGHGKRDDETVGQYIVRTALTESVYDKPLMHLLAQVMTPVLFGKSPNTGAISIPVVKQLERIATDVGTLASRSQPMDKKMFAALDAGGQVLGPSISRAIKGGYKLTRYYMLGRNDFLHTPQGPLDAGSSLFYGERHEGTPLTDLQRLLNQLSGVRAGSGVAQR